ncbi:hypothetical protein B9479_007054 [Cryptococcus floricola]|uniref:Retrovirus-related Pol polyprotein from transposon TNT 1-94-like beta-barrel domain-containing protein n=1 Tax=Cryptococcus floricola TaxID=2591691 RepID=A0A5D3AQL7_9TREE|nr:hypothetical protein B9479_007054 [Cryptococcus floricola]
MAHSAPGFVLLSHVALQASSSPNLANHWVFDTGASLSMTGDVSWFSTPPKPLTRPINVTVADGSTLVVAGSADVCLLNHEGAVVQVRDVYYVPNLQRHGTPGDCTTFLRTINRHVAARFPAGSPAAAPWVALHFTDAAGLGLSRPPQPIHQIAITFLS